MIWNKFLHFLRWPAFHRGKVTLPTGLCFAHLCPQYPNWMFRFRILEENATMPETEKQMKVFIHFFLNMRKISLRVPCTPDNLDLLWKPGREEIFQHILSCTSWILNHVIIWTIRNQRNKRFKKWSVLFLQTVWLPLEGYNRFFHSRQSYENVRSLFVSGEGDKVFHTLIYFTSSFSNILQIKQ